MRFLQQGCSLQHFNNKMEERLNVHVRKQIRARQTHPTGLRHNTEMQVITLNVHCKHGFLYAPKQMKGYDGKQ